MSNPIPGSDEDSPTPPGVPFWVKVLGIIALGIVVLIIAVALAGGGEHGPGRHLPGGDGGVHTVPAQRNS